ncbi:MAG: hypothetical protein [Microvirus sp.]|nr:MAG: hypothetical protein [Microvirus sp.]
MEIEKYWTTTEYIDIDTGEIISKKNATENYIIIKKQRHVNIKQEIKHRRKYNIGIVTYRYECTKNGSQIRLW